MAQTRLAPQRIKNQWISQSLRFSMPSGSRRLAQSMAAMAMLRPAMAAMFSRSTSQKPKYGLSGLGNLLRRLTVHITRPVPTIAVPARLVRKYSQRTVVSPKRPRCRA